MRMKVSDVQRGYRVASAPPRRKARLNITVDAALLAEAKAQGLPLSSLMEEKIADTLKADRAMRWREENREAIKYYNNMIETEGLWSDGLRQF
jgi:antitoxin CcdA